jgi:hypothetical protein
MKHFTQDAAMLQTSSYMRELFSTEKLQNAFTGFGQLWHRAGGANWPKGWLKEHSIDLKPKKVWRLAVKKICSLEPSIKSRYSLGSAYK